MATITVSRQFGSLDEELARLLTDKLGYEFYELEEILEKLVPELDAARRATLLEQMKLFRSEQIDGRSIYDCFRERLLRYADEHHLILLGFGAAFFFEDRDDALHVRVIAPKSLRRERIAKKYRLSLEEAEHWLEISDRRFQRLVTHFHRIDQSDPASYDLCLNSRRMDAEALCRLVTAALCTRQLDSRRRESSTSLSPAQRQDVAVLKNPSEREFVKILNRYRLEWHYEPKTFPLEWDEEGKVSLAFRPDFYLPRFDLYLELTTMDQHYTKMKKRKTRLMRELYPEINLRILYRKDFEEILKHLSMDLDE